MSASIMKEITFPSKFEDLLDEKLGFHIQDVWDSANVSEYEVNNKVDGMEYFFKGEMNNIEDVQPIFDDLYSIISGFESLTPESKDHVCHTVNSIQNHLIQLIHSVPHIPLTIRNVIKIFLYFYQNLYKNAEAYFDNHMSTGLMISKSAAAAGNGSGNLALEDGNDDDEFVSAAKPSKGKKSKAAVAKKGAKKPSVSNALSTFDWLKWRQVFLKANMEWVEIEPLKLWSMGIIPEVVLGNFWEYSLYILEKRPLGTNAHNATEIALRTLCIDIVAKTTKLFGNYETSGSYVSLATCLINSLTTSECMASYIAEICTKCNHFLIQDLLHEIGKPHIAKMPNVKNVGTFMELLTKLNPELIIQNLPVINGQIDSPAHQIRSSVITALGYLVAHIHTLCIASNVSDTSANAASEENPTEAAAKAVNSDDPAHEKVDEDDDDDNHTSVSAVASVATDSEKAMKNIKQLLRVRDSIVSILIERTRDKSYFTRAAVLKAWGYLLDQSAIPVRHMTSICELAYDRLVDKTAMVRKNAISLLTSILDNNPFGGELDIKYYLDLKQKMEVAVIQRIEEIRSDNPLQMEQDEEDNEAEDEISAPRVATAKSKGHVAAGDRKVNKKNLSVILEEEEEDEDDEVEEEEKEEIAQKPKLSAAEEEQRKDMKKLKEQMRSDRYQEFIASEDVQGDADFIALKAKLDFSQDAINLVSAIKKALDRIQDMLFSKTAYDVVEALQFITRAVNFRIEDSDRSLQKAFQLVWHQDVAIKTECLTAFSNVYMTDGNILDEPQPLTAEETTDNLVKLCLKCAGEELKHSASPASANAATAVVTASAAGTAEGSEHDMPSLEQIIGELFLLDKFHHLRNQVHNHLWSMVESHGTSQQQQATGGRSSDKPSVVIGAVFRLLAMIIKFSKDEAHAVAITSALKASQVELVAQVGFHSAVYAQKDIFTLKSSCVLLQQFPAYIYAMNNSKKVAALVTDPSLFPESHTELQKAYDVTKLSLCTLLLGDYCGEDTALTGRWYSVCEEAMHTLYHATACPDKIVGLVLIKLHADLATNSSTTRLARLVFLLGQTALCTLVYAEKIASITKKVMENEKSTNNSKSKRKSVGSSSTAASAVAASALKTPAVKKTRNSSIGGRGSTGGGLEEAEEMEMEMGLAASADADHEMTFNNIIEKKIVQENLLGKFHPLVAYIVANENETFNDQMLRETALLALCRYMSVSAEICEKYLPLLFTALEREVCPQARTTVMIGLGDLAFRFPNALEPWTSHLYSRLNDDSTSVRYNTLTVLTHLILNDMVKVKGQVSHVVLCLNDPCDRIKDLAATFFTKLSERSNNPVYNLLGDIIANLSRDSTAAVTEGSSTAQLKNSTLDDSATAVGTDEQEQDAGDDTETSAVATLPPAAAAAVNVSQVNVAIDRDVVNVAELADAMTNIPSNKYLNKADFQKVMSFMLSFVKKDIQANSLLDRLLMRLSMATSSAQKKKLSYCISLLKINEKGVKKIVDMFRNIKEALYDCEVRDNIVSAVRSVKRTFGNRSNNGTGEEAEAGGGSSATAGNQTNAVTTAANSASSVAETKSIMSEFEALLDELDDALSGRQQQQDEAGENGPARAQTVTAEGDNDDAEEEVATSRTTSSDITNKSTRQNTKETKKVAVASAAKGSKKPTKKPAVATTSGKGKSKKATKYYDSDEDEEADDEDDEEEEDDEDEVNEDSENRDVNSSKASSSRSKPPAVASVASNASSKSSKGPNKTPSKAAAGGRLRRNNAAAVHDDDDD